MGGVSLKIDLDIREVRLAWAAMRGEFPMRRIDVVDPDDPRQRNVYEDIEVEDGSCTRMCLVSLHPECAEAIANGLDPVGSQEVISHAKALADIEKLLKQGWVLVHFAHDKIKPD